MELVCTTLIVVVQTKKYIYFTVLGALCYEDVMATKRHGLVVVLHHNGIISLLFLNGLKKTDLKKVIILIKTFLLKVINYIRQKRAVLFHEK